MTKLVRFPNFLLNANSDLYDIHCIFFVHPSCAPGIVDSGPKDG